MNTKAQKHFFKQCVSFAEITVNEGERTSRVQILRTGAWNHPAYGSFTVSPQDLDEFVQNFKDNVRGVDLAIDVNHDPNHKAIGWIRNVFREGNALFADIEWNEEGAAQISSKAYRYFSPELYFTFRDEETGKEMRNVLIGGGITNRPFFKGMQALKMSESENTEESQQFYIDNTEQMHKFAQLFAELSVLATIGADKMKEVKLAFSELGETEQADNKENMDALEAKAEVVDTQVAADAAAAQAIADAAAANTEALAASEATEAAIFSETGMKMADIKEMQKKFSDLQRAAQFAETEKKVGEYMFSESNKKGILLPKAKEKVCAFASKLSDTLAKEFFDILASKSFRIMDLGEITSDAVSEEFSVPDATPENVTRESFVLDSIAKAFQAKTSGLEYTEAVMQAAKHIRENSIK